MVVLWPLWLQPIALAPSSKRQELDLLARGVRDVMALGIGDAPTIAKVLCLDERVVRAVRDRVKDRGSLDAHAGEPSEAIVWLAHDALVDRSLPRLLAGVYEQEARLIDTRNRMELREPGGRARRRTVVDFLAPVSTTAPRPPEGEAVFDAITRFLTAVGRNNPQTPEVLRIAGRNVSVRPVVDMEPEPAFVPLVVHSDAVSADGWAVWDPMIENDTELFKSPMRALASTHPVIAEAIASVGVASDNDATDQDLADMEARLRLDPQVHQLIDGPLRAEVLRVFRPLVRRELEASQGTAVGKEHSEHALTAAARLVEGVVEDLIGRFPAARQGSDALTGRAEVLTALGQACDIPTWPGKIASVPSDEVKSALRGRARGLRPLLMAALISAVVYPEHPLRRVLATYPASFDVWDQLAEMRNAAAHGGASRQGSMPGTVESTIYSSVASALELHRITHDMTREDNGSGS